MNREVSSAEFEDSLWIPDASWCGGEELPTISGPSGKMSSHSSRKPSACGGRRSCSVKSPSPSGNFRGTPSHQQLGLIATQVVPTSHKGSPQKFEVDAVQRRVSPRQNVTPLRQKRTVGLAIASSL